VVRHRDPAIVEGVRAMRLAIELSDDQIIDIASCVADVLSERFGRSLDCDLLTLDDAAALAGVKRATVANWLSRGRLARHGVPRKPMVSRQDVLALVGPQQRADAIRTTAKKRPNGGQFGALARKYS
jgi:Helix-turn-helix domain